MKKLIIFLSIVVLLSCCNKALVFQKFSLDGYMTNILIEKDSFIKYTYFFNISGEHCFRGISYGNTHINKDTIELSSQKVNDILSILKIYSSVSKQNDSTCFIINNVLFPCLISFPIGLKYGNTRAFDSLIRVVEILKVKKQNVDSVQLYNLKTNLQSQFVNIDNKSDTVILEIADYKKGYHIIDTLCSKFLIRINKGIELPEDFIYKRIRWKKAKIIRDELKKLKDSLNKYIIPTGIH